MPIACIDALIAQNRLLIPHIALLPACVQCNDDSPPEVELKFVMECTDKDKPETWPNWQLQFLHNQLFRLLEYPGRFCPSAFHMTFVRKAGFRSQVLMKDYMRHCEEVVELWRSLGPQFLEPEKDPKAAGYIACPLGCELESPHGLYLFRHRNLPINYYPPNFHPPYDTPEKRAIIREVLSHSWDENTLQWTSSF